MVLDVAFGEKHIIHVCPIVVIVRGGCVLSRYWLFAVGAGGGTFDSLAGGCGCGGGLSGRGGATVATWMGVQSSREDCDGV